MNLLNWDSTDPDGVIRIYVNGGCERTAPFRAAYYTFVDTPGVPREFMGYFDATLPSSAHMELAAITGAMYMIICSQWHDRTIVIHTIPTLTQLDFSTITRQDRETAAAWALTFRNKLAGRPSNEDDVGAF